MAYEERKASILIVDDNPSNLRALIDYLEQWNFDTLVATSGERALQQLELYQPDLILLDVLMPGMNGFETCRHLKANGATRDIPVIFMTALSDTISKVAGFEAGGVDYVTKPFQFEELLARIQANLTIRNLQKQLQEQNIRFQGLVEATFEGIILYEHERIFEANQAMVRLFGYPYDDLLQKNIFDLFTSESRNVIRPRFSSDQILVLDGRRNDGSTFTLEMQSKTMAYQGRDVRVAAVRDITQRKQAEEKLKESVALIERAKQEWETTADSLSYVICLLDRKGCVLRVNRTAEYWNLGQVIDVKGYTLHELFHPGCHNTTCALSSWLTQAWKNVLQGKSAEFEIKDPRLERHVYIQIRPLTGHAENDVQASPSFAVCSVNDITKRKQAEESLRQRNRELAILNKMSEAFQACSTEQETYTIVMSACKELFPLQSGYLYVMNPSQTMLLLVASWGEPSPEHQEFSIDSSRPLQHGKAHIIEQPDTDLLCAHLNFAPKHTYLCVPVSTSEQLLGVLHVCLAQNETEHSDAARTEIIASKQLVVSRLTEHYALFLVNLRLRDRLKIESIRDPLTQLYNRRYMEESLAREVHHAERHNAPIGIVMLDIDRFKTFNDTYGHEVGDNVLRELGTLLRRHTRSEDIACRYGGEEFLLIFPETSLEVVHQRAEELRVIVKELLQIVHQGSILTITVSMGVAVFPIHGRTVRKIVNAADRALYQAKRNGRNQVVLVSP